MADDQKMPEVARRKGGADTLFSAAWFDDNDDFTGKRPAGDGESAAPDGSEAADASQSPASSGPPLGLILGGLAVLALFGGCSVGGLAAALYLVLGTGGV